MATLNVYFSIKLGIYRVKLKYVMFFNSSFYKITAKQNHNWKTELGNNLKSKLKLILHYNNRDNLETYSLNHPIL